MAFSKTLRARPIWRGDETQRRPRPRDGKARTTTTPQARHPYDLTHTATQVI
jgi:hypothetical protein